jgi:hypothetical protein
MEKRRFDRLSRWLVRSESRRSTLRALGAGVLVSGLGGLGLGEALARKKKGKKKCKDCCLANGSQCNKTNSKCKAKHCLSTPFTIEAHWTNPGSDHDTYLFVPNQAGASLPAPFIDYYCNASESACESDLYPFTCVSKDAAGPGDELTTVRKLLPGTYEYWIELNNSSPAGDLTVTLRRPNGSVVRSWSSPPNPSVADQIGWHVFDIGGKRGSIVSIDQTIAGDVPDGAHDPNTHVCPAN